MFSINFRRKIAYIFFIMTPFFPGNNGIEISIIGTLVGWIHPFLPEGTNRGFVRALVYFIYNIIGISGYFLLREKGKPIRFSNLMELSVGILLLFLTSYIPDPFDMIVLSSAAVFFLRTEILGLLKKLFH